MFFFLSSVTSFRKLVWFLCVWRSSLSSVTPLKVVISIDWSAVKVSFLTVFSFHSEYFLEIHSQRNCLRFGEPVKLTPSDPVQLAKQGLIRWNLFLHVYFSGCVELKADVILFNLCNNISEAHGIMFHHWQAQAVQWERICTWSGGRDCVFQLSQVLFAYLIRNWGYVLQ